MTYRVLDRELNRAEFEAFLIGFIYAMGYTSETVGNLLPQYTIEKNVHHHPYRIAREIGLKVTIIRG